MTTVGPLRIVRDRERHRAPAVTRARAATGERSSNAMLLLAIVVVLNVIGVVMVLSASSVASLTDYGSPWYFFFRQLIWTVLGVVAFVVAVRIDYQRWQRLVTPLMIASAALLVVVLVPCVGIHVSGSPRWLRFDLLPLPPP